MNQQLRYENPADNHRPYGSTRYEVWSPKLHRGMTLYGDIPLNAWIFLESLPDVEAFCERPLAFNKTTKSKRVADFWVKWKNKEEIWLLKRKSEEKQLQQDKQLYPNFQDWAQANGMEMRLITHDLAEWGEIEMHNWSTILHFLAANYDQVHNNHDLHIKVLNHFSCTKSLETLLHSEKRSDPVILQATIFYLLHKGRLKSEDISNIPLSLMTKFQVA